MFSQLFLALKCKTEKRGFSFFFWLNPISRWQDESCLYRCVPIYQTRKTIFWRATTFPETERKYWKIENMTRIGNVINWRLYCLFYLLNLVYVLNWEIKATLLIKIRYSTLSSSSCHLFILEDVLMSLRDGFPDRRPTKTKHVSDFKLGLELQFKILMSLIAL